jgi:hypothetical protein
MIDGVGRLAWAFGGIPISDRLQIGKCDRWVGRLESGHVLG